MSEGGRGSGWLHIVHVFKSNLGSLQMATLMASVYITVGMYGTGHLNCIFSAVPPLSAHTAPQCHLPRCRFRCYTAGPLGIVATRGQGSAAERQTHRTASASLRGLKCGLLSTDCLRGVPTFAMPQRSGAHSPRTCTGMDSRLGPSRWRCCRTRTTVAGPTRQRYAECPTAPRPAFVVGFDSRFAAALGLPQRCC